MPSGARSFLQRLLGGSPRSDPAPAEAPAGATLYVVGDVHGRSDLLQILLRRIAEDAREDGAAGGRRELIFLGDYVDRGPDSRGVIDAILGVAAWEDAWAVTALKGNHEAALLQFLEEPEFWPRWADYGARETLLSYGVNPPGRTAEAEDYGRASRELNAALPAEHHGFLADLKLSADRGDYLCVHAGVRPDVPLDSQVENDLMWIREDFLRNQKYLGKVIVHGHTPAADAFLGPHRIGLDTGAYATSVLSAVKLRGEARTVIQARGKD
jgi:serine/threonine protein phosphatase 1